MPQNKGKNRGRKPSRLRKVRRILILCEDTKSSRDYFARFPFDKDQVEIDCVGTGMNTDSLVENAIKRAKNARDAGTPYERVWVVFDKDDFDLKNFNRAFELASAHKEITPCWSNECFELWYLLHFHYRDTAVGRHELWPLISKQLGRKYDKADETLYSTMEKRLDTALKNAKKLAFENETNGVTRRNPSTHIHRLVETLREFDPNKQTSNS